VIDPMHHLATRHQTLLDEANHERLLALLPPRYSPARRGIAFVCRRLANWIDDPKRYVRPADAGPADWVTHSAGV
jgi:hypothetical protein